jgi:4-amino-4-deoxy-L-arabinose transferase-like glycosyltransferase
MGSIDRETFRDGLAAGSVAAVVSGAPSTLHALLTGGRPLEASLAAGTLLLPGERRATWLLPAAAAVHVALSLGWALVLADVLPRKRTTVLGALAGLGIAALDLGVIGRRYQRIRALPQLPQVADHLAYGATVGAVLHLRRGRQGRPA